MASSTTSEQVEKYMNEFEEKEKKALKIAQEHLETSFNIVKSNGFSEWKKKQTSTTSSSSSFFSFAVFVSPFSRRRVVCFFEFIDAFEYSFL